MQMQFLVKIVWFLQILLLFLREILQKRLAMKGYKELVLTGIHLSSYGLEKDTKKEQPLIHLGFFQYALNNSQL